MNRNEEVFYTQKELATRWKISEGCVKKWRDKGIIPFFRLPGSSRILFPVKEVKKIEEKNTTIAKGVEKPKKTPEIKRNKPAMSTTRKEWRI